MGSDQKIKVCHIISGDLWAGAEVQAYTLLKQLANMPDIDLTAIILNEGKLAEKVRACRVEVLVIDESQYSFMKILRHARSYLSEKNVDIIHSHRRKENVLAGLLKRSGHAGLLVQTVHGAPEPFRGLNRLKEKIYMMANGFVTNRYFDHILPVSDDLSRQIQRRLIRGRLTTIHNSIEIDQVTPHRSGFEVRRELGLDESRLVVGSAGRMVPVKGFDLFLGAAKTILETMPQTAFVLAGDGPMFDAIKDMSVELGISKDVILPGFREDIVDVLNCLDIFVVTSHHEGIPTVVLEAMALRKPVVATAVGGMNEIIESGISGVLVKPGDSHAISSACLNLLNDKPERTKLGDSARESVQDKFSADRQAKKVADIYRQLQSRGGS